MIKEFCEQDREALYEIYHDVIEAGCYFPQSDSSKEEFERCFFAPGSRVFVCKVEGQLVGGFYIKPNFPGRGCHIANAAYMLKEGARGQGLGRQLCEKSFQLARELGFRAMQYNMVFSDNLPAIHLYKKLGFTIIGTVPNAIKRPDGTYQDGHVMHRPLVHEITRFGAHAVVMDGDKLLLTRKEGGPYKGRWGLPGGKIEFGESPEETVERELLEEAALEVSDLQLLTTIHHCEEYGELHFHHVGIIYRAGQFSPQLELTAEEEVRWVIPEEACEEELTPFARQIVMGARRK